jgi:SAM-dependent methyltransferase
MLGGGAGLSAISRYFDEELMRRRIANAGHRRVIGGLWEELGTLQREFLISQGLEPHHLVLDIGCGSLRAGLPLTRFLEPSGYYGIDISESLIETGYQQEIVTAGLVDRLPRDHLHVTDAFAAPFGVWFDFGIAQSLFSHLSLNYFSNCLAALAGTFKTGGVIYATFFEGEGEQVERPDGIITRSTREPFHFPKAEILAMATSDWTLEWVGDWGHPRGQIMVRARRT